MMRYQIEDESLGFSLIELLVSITIASVLMAGLYSNFIVQSRVQNMQSEVVEAAEDLRVAAQIMQSELRMAEEICWDNTNKRLIYKPLGAASSLATCPTASVDATHGFFRDNGGTVCWDQPNDGTNCQELLRGLNASTGFIVVMNDSMLTVRLTSVYKNQEKQDTDWQVRFNVWPRNQ